VVWGSAYDRGPMRVPALVVVQVVAATMLAGGMAHGTEGRLEP